MARSYWRFVICALSTLLASEHLAAQTPDARKRAELRITFLGWAGWEITDGRTVVLVDPWLSRQTHDSIGRARGMARMTLEARREELLPPHDSATLDARVPRADFILVTHGHADHAFDAPYIARKHGAVIIGNESVVNIARAYGVVDTSLIAAAGGDDYEFGSFSLKVIPNIHTVVTTRAYKRIAPDPTTGMGTTPRGLTAPLRIRDFQEGGNKAYLLRIAGHQVLIMGSMNYIEREMDGLRPDVAIVGARNSRRQIHDYTRRLLRALGHPALVLPTHCCVPPSADEEAQTFASEVKAASPRTRVVIPKLYETIVVPPAR